MENVELIVSSRLWTPNELSPMRLAKGVFCVFSSAGSEERELLLPRWCPLFSISFSDLRKKVVGAAAPALEAGAPTPAFFAFTVFES